MELRRSELDSIAFALALAAMGAAALAFVITLNGAALIMASLCFAGLVAGRLIGAPGTVLLPVAIGLCGILWLIWVSPIDRYVSPTSHLVGGILAGWALAETFRSRHWAGWALAALATVALLTVAWEIGEYVGDRALDTALIPDRSDSAFDIFFGSLGGAVGVTIAGIRAAILPGG
jgi:hypothetical protein